MADVRAADAPLAPAATDSPAQVVIEAQTLASQMKAGQVSTELVNRQRDLAARLQQLLVQGQTIPPLPPAESTPGTADEVLSTNPAESQGAVSAGPGVSPESATRSPNSPAAEAALIPVVAPGVHPLTDAVWGHLPQHERDELYRSFTEKFLPKYDNALKAYFRALAEEDPQREQ